MQKYYIFDGFYRLGNAFLTLIKQHTSVKYIFLHKYSETGLNFSELKS